MADYHCSSTEKIKMIESKAFGHSVNEISDAAGRDQRTVRRWLKRWTNEDTIDTRPRSGRRFQLNHRDQVKLLAFVLKNPSATLREMKTALEFTCTIKTIDNYLDRNKVKSFIAPKKPSHYPRHLDARFTFAKILRNWCRWYQVIFSDESGFTNQRSCARRVWRQRGIEPPIRATSFNATRNLRINVWGAISSNGFVALKLVSDNFDSAEYLDVVSECLPNLFGRFPNAIWMHDNASIHKTQAIRNFFQESDFQKILWPARSPDLNPIENIWGNITQKLDKLVDIEREATTKDELWRRVRLCASEIPRDQFKNLYDSIQKRLKIVFENGGYYTNY